MSTKELSIQEKLSQLYNLQLIDSKLDEIKIMKGELPMEVSDLEDDLAGLETRRKRLAEAVSDIEGEIKNHSVNAKHCETLIEKYNKQLDNVKNNREFDALNKEIEMQKLEIQLSEKKMKEAAVILKNKEEALANIQEKIAGRQKDLSAKQKELEDVIAKTEKEEEKLIKESVKNRKEIEERLLKAYDKIRATYRNGLAVATLSRESCGGCFNKIPPQKQIEIGVMKTIVACEHCGRVLIDEAFVHQATEH